MSSSAPVQQGDVVVVTQMYPTPSQAGVVCNQLPQQMCTRTGSFVQSNHVALGTVQIMIGLMVFSFGVVLVNDYSLAVSSSVFAWGAVFYITAGSLTVAAGKSTNHCLINTTLAFNVVATLAACFATIMYTIDAVVMGYCLDYSYDCSRDEILVEGIRIVLTMFHFLEFIITIVVSAIACKSTCTCCHEQQQPVYIIPNASIAPQAQQTYSPAPATVVQLPSQMMNVSSPAGGQSFPGMPDPPKYSEEKHPEKQSHTTTTL